MNWVKGQPVDWTTPDTCDEFHTYCGNCGCDTPGCGCPRETTICHKVDPDNGNCSPDNCPCLLPFS